MNDDAVKVESQMDRTMASLTDKLGKLEHRVTGTVESVKDSVTSVRDTFDIKLQIRRRPWTMVAGAAALGFAGAVRRSRAGDGARVGPNCGCAASQTKTAPAMRPAAPPNGNKDREIAAPRRSAPDGPGWLANLGAAFEPQIAELKGIAIGTLLSVVHEMLDKKMPRADAAAKRDGGGAEDHPQFGQRSQPPT